MSKKVQILIADDHAVVREGTRALIEREPGWEVCGVATNGREAVDLCAKLKPDVLVLDLNMSDMNGLDVLRELKKRELKTDILIFSAHQAEEVVPELFDAGAKSYIRKTDDPAQLVAAIRSLSEHKPYFTTDVWEILFERYKDRDRKSKSGAKEGKLSVREREIIRLLAQGKSNKEAADSLGISVRTIETHRASLMRKLEVNSLAEVVRYALRNGIIEE